MKSQKGLEKQYQRELNKLGKALILSVNTELMPFLKNTQKSYIIDGIGDMLNTIFSRLNAMFTGTIIAGFAKNTSAQMVSKVVANNKRRFNKTIERVTGVNLGGIVTSEVLNDFVELSISKNVDLIENLSQEYLKQIKVIVNNGVINGTRYSEIAKQIQTKTGANGKLANRIKTIARNEVQTVNSQISLRRSEALGIKKGIWVSSDDERVRECHDKRDGLEYEISKGLYSKCDNKTIRPGEEINCRCSFRPIIEVD